MLKCRECNRELTNDNWFPSLRKRGSLICKACNNKKMKEWRKNNPDKTYDVTKRFLKRNPGYQRKYYSRHRRKLRLEILKEYGDKCSECGIDDKVVLDIDHIENDGAVQRKSGIYGITLLRWIKKNNFPKDKFQLLCKNCNWKKHINNIG